VEVGETALVCSAVRTSQLPEEAVVEIEAERDARIWESIGEDMADVMCVM